MRYTLPRKPRAGERVFISLAQVPDIDVAANEFKHTTFAATTDASGNFYVRVAKTSAGGAWVINGLEIRAAQSPLTLSGPAEKHLFCIASE